MRRLVPVAGLAGLVRLARQAPLALLATVFLFACESDPSGPGTFVGSVVGGEVTAGAAVILVEGPGITGVSAEGMTRVFSAPLPPDAEGETSYRVVLVNTGPGNLEFRVDVEDVGADEPRGRIIQVVDTENQRASSLLRYQVRISR